jgi:hypothetical protein
MGRFTPLDRTHVSKWHADGYYRNRYKHDKHYPAVKLLTKALQ